MILGRVRQILIVLIALQAGWQVDRACGAFVRIQDGALPLIDKSVIALSLGNFAAEEGSLAGESSPEPASRSRLGNHDNRPSPPALQQLFGQVPVDSGPSGTSPSSQSHLGGSPTAALSSSGSHLPQATLISRLPRDMGPAFSNPPPRTLLRPPRD